MDSAHPASLSLIAESTNLMLSSRMGIPPESVPSPPEKRYFMLAAKRRRASLLHSYSVTAPMLYLGSWVLCP